MTSHRAAFRRLALSTILIALPLNAAFAQDTTAIADRLKAKLSEMSIDIAWSGISGDTSSMVLEGVSVKPAGEPDALPIGNVTLEDIEEAGGAYTIGSLKTQPFSKTEDGIALDMSALVIDGLSLPAPGDTDPVSSIMMYDNVELANVTVKVADKTAFSMEGLAVELTRPADGKAMTFTGAAEKFTSDLSLIEDPQSKAVIDALGYQTIAGYLEMAGSWQPTDGRMSLSQYDISIENAGTIGLTFDFGGYTPAFLQSMQTLQKQMAAQPAGADDSAQGMAMLGLMQQLTLHGATVRFDDDTLTNKVLDFLAAQQGMTKADIANQAKAIVPFLMAQLNNPELTTAVSAAVNTYLDNPESLVVAVQPAQPVPFAMLAATAMSTPQTLPQQLGLKVDANK